MSTKITYYLPKKVLKISLPLIVVEKKTTYNSGRSEVHPVESYIRGDVKITPILVPDEQRGKFTYLPDDMSFLKKNTVAVEYDGEGAGLLLSLNTSQVNLVGDVISAAIDVAAALLPAVGLAAMTAQPGAPAASAHPAASADLIASVDPVASVDYAERQLDIVQLVTPGRDKTVPVVLPDLPNKPRVSVTFRDNPGTVYREPAPDYPAGDKAGSGAGDKGASPACDKAASGAGDKNNIWYLAARPMIMTVIVENNSYIPRQTVVEEIVYFPQFGELSPVEIVRKSWWFFGAINTSVTFSPSTGSLQKFCVTAESNINDLLADAGKGIDASEGKRQKKR